MSILRRPRRLALVLLKAHVKSYYRTLPDGRQVLVREHETSQARRWRETHGDTDYEIRHVGDRFLVHIGVKPPDGKRTWRYATERFTTQDAAHAFIDRHQNITPVTPPVETKPPPRQPPGQTKPPPRTPPVKTKPPGQARQLDDLTFDELTRLQDDVINRLFPRDGPPPSQQVQDQLLHRLRQIEHVIAARKPPVPGKPPLARPPVVTKPPPAQGPPPVTPPQRPPAPPSTGDHDWTTRSPGKPNQWAAPLADEVQMHNEAFSHAPPSVVKALRKAPGLVSVRLDDKSVGTSFYLPARPGYAGKLKPDGTPQIDRAMPTRAGHISLQPAHGARPAKRQAVWRHEVGHHIDFSMGWRIPPQPQGATAEHATIRPDNINSVSASPFQAAALEHDSTQLVTHRTPQAQEDAMVAVRQRHMARLDALQATGQSEQASMDTLLREQGFTPTEVYPLVSTNRASVTAFLAALENRNTTRLLDVLSERDPMCHNFQDFLSAVTRNGVRVNYRHDDGYYSKTPACPGRTGYRHGHTQEAFANWWDAQGARVSVWRTIYQRMAPQTHAAFQGMVEAWLENKPIPRAVPPAQP